MKTSTIIYNPMSGRPGRRAENVRAMQRMLDARDINSEAQATSAPGDATRLASEAIGANVDLVIAYGGDGTINEVIQGMAGSHVPLAIWPGGTSNVVAKDLGLPFDNQRLADVIGAGRTNRISLGKATGGSGFGVQGLAFTSAVEGSNVTVEKPTAILAGAPQTRNPELQTYERYFLMMAGIGLDASVARGCNQRLKRRTGEFAYWVSGIKH
ncbi:MAG TPA: diacylglycerol kinase family protein, partial [Blastocatellia bacterium]|nr:diacylglycerol kinase family protein [Blastocatellia bacterium]